MWGMCEVKMEENEVYELLKKIRKFEDRSNTRLKEQWNRIKADKEFIWEKPLSEEVSKLLGKKRYRGRVDVISNAIRSVVNSYTSYPYKPRTGIDELHQAYQKLDDSISESVENAFKNAVSFGLGYIVVLPVEQNGVIAPIPYSIDKVENVFYDPDSTDMNGADAIECLIVDYKSKKFLEQKYGEDVANKLKGANELTLNTIEPINDDMGAVFTYFKRENGLVNVYKIVGDTLVEEPLQLQLKQLPIIPVYGEPYEYDGKRIYRGIVSQCKVIQDMTDMTASQLMERLAKSPKNMWLTTRDAVAGNEDYFQNSDKNINQILYYNNKKGKEDVPPPQRLEQTVQYSDLTDIMQNSIGMMQSVVGVQSIGLPDEKNEITATEALLNAKTYNNNIRHFMSHLKYSFKALCELIAEYFGVEDTIVIENGPQENLERQTARQELMALTQMLDDPSDRKRAIIAVASTMNDNVFVKPFMEAISQEDPALTQLKQQATQMQQNYEQTIAELKNQITLLKTQAIAADTRNKETLAKAQLDNATKLAIEQMKQQGENDRKAAEMVNDNMKDLQNPMIDGGVL
jgi:hypothetical protein